jgi:hypothetical protein
MQTISPPVAPQPAFQQLPVSTKPWEVLSHAGTPAPAQTFPLAGKNYIDGMGATVTPTIIRSGWGN